MQKGKLLFCLTLTVVTLQVVAFDVDSLRSLSQDELLDYLEYYVRLGYRLVHGDVPKLRFRSAQTSSDAFAIGVYKWAVENYSVGPGLERRGVVCFPNGQCVNLGDLGVHP